MLRQILGAIAAMHIAFGYLDNVSFSDDRFDVTGKEVSVDGLKCVYVYSSGFGSLCCETQLNQINCSPRVIIAGTQKSGTTILSGSRIKQLM